MAEKNNDLDLLWQQLQILKRAGFEVDQSVEFFEHGVGELAFDGVYYFHVRHPGLLKQSDIDYLIPIFGERLSELERKDST